MSSLREEIRAILREEIAALKNETSAPSGREKQSVRITSSADVNRFARDLVARAADPHFASQVANGQLVFELAGGAPTTVQPNRVQPMPGLVVSPARQRGAHIDKTIITERDIAALDATTRALQLSKRARLTPLAKDEAGRRGIRIERTEP